MKTFSLLLTALTLAIAAPLLAAPDKPAFPSLRPLPAAPSPKDNPQTPEKIALGKQLFWDNRLSGDGSMPCVSCHLPGLGWGDGGQISRGYPGTKHWRNSQTVLNSAYYNKIFWEGNNTSLESQAASASQGAVAGNGDAAMMEMRLRFIPDYVAAFKQVFGTPWPRLTQAYQAIAAFERTLVSDPKQVAFDRYSNGDKKALSSSQLNGMRLFNGKAGCLQCHNGALASDQRFYNLGVPEFEGFKEDPLLQITFRWELYQKGVAEPLYRHGERDLGLYFVTKSAKDKGKFRTPSLREVKYTGPYMHNGVFTTLDEVIEFYNKGGGEASNKAAQLRPLGLNADEKRDLQAFVEALSMDAPLLIDDPQLPDYAPLK